MAWVSVRVDPKVKALSSFQVPPNPSKLMGKSSVLPFVVMLRAVPEVEANVRASVPAVIDIPVENTMSP